MHNVMYSIVPMQSLAVRSSHAVECSMCLVYISVLLYYNYYL